MFNIQNFHIVMSMQFLWEGSVYIITYFRNSLQNYNIWVPCEQVLQTYCNVASRCLLGVDSSRLSSRFHLSLFALYSFFFCVSNALRSCSCRPQISFCSFFSAVKFCFNYDKKNLHLLKMLVPTLPIQN